MAAAELASSSALTHQYCSHCKQACSSISYIVIPSAVQAPTAVAAHETKGLIESKGVPLTPNWTKDWEGDVTKNYLELEVVCQLSLIENTTEQPLIRPIDVLSNIGGQTGLWIGISFLSIMELVEMLYRLVRHEFRAIRKGRGTAPAQNSMSNRTSTVAI